VSRFPDLAHQQVYEAILDSFLLGQTAAEALLVALSAVTEAQAALAALQADVTTLKAQVAALTPIPTPGPLGGGA
jgi:hypothetical protein